MLRGLSRELVRQDELRHLIVGGGDVNRDRGLTGRYGYRSGERLRAFQSHGESPTVLTADGHGDVLSDGGRVCRPAHRQRKAIALVEDAFRGGQRQVGIFVVLDGHIGSACRIVIARDGDGDDGVVVNDIIVGDGHID